EGGMGRTFGLVNGLFVICMIIGPIMGGQLVKYYDFKVMMGVATSIFFAATVLRVWLAARVPFQPKSFHPQALINDLSKLIGLFLGGGLLLWLFLMDGLTDAGVQLALPFLPDYITEIGNLSEDIYTLLYASM